MAKFLVRTRKIGTCRSLGCDNFGPAMHIKGDTLEKVKAELATRISEPGLEIEIYELIDSGVTSRQPAVINFKWDEKKNVAGWVDCS